MKVKGITLLAALLAFPAVVHAQSTLIFARVIEPAEFATTGFAITNLGPADAAVTFRLYNIAGQTLSSSTRNIPARGQFAKVASELFPNTGAAAWVEAASTTTGLRGLWVAGDFVNFADGADAAVSSSELVLPLVTPQSEINIVNPSSGTLAVLMRIYGESGTELAIPVVRPIPAKGFFKGQVSDLFPGTATAARHIRLKCTLPFSASLIAKDFLAGPSRAIVNALDPLTSPIDFSLPHVVHGPLNTSLFTGVIGVTNLAPTEQSVTVTFTTEDGASTYSAPLTLPGNGAIRLDLLNLFGLPNAYYDGWIRASGTQPITGFVVYAEATGGSVAVATPQPPQRELLFTHIADLPPWWTGIALLNPSIVQNATVEVFAMTPEGNLIGGARNVSTARLTIPAGQKIARLLVQWIPQTQSRTTDGGFVYVRSDVPLYGLGLFFTRDVRILSNAPPASISPGISYTPPDPR